MTYKEHDNELDDRYQFQSFFVRCKRWLRWMPYYYFLGVKQWIKNTTYKKDPYVSPRDMFSIYKGLAHCKMKYYWTSEEVFSNIRGKLGLTNEKAEDNQSEES